MSQPEITEAEQMLVLNAAFAEHFAGFTRSLGADGWRWNQEGRDLLPIEQLPHVERSGFQFIQFLEDVCKHTEQTQAEQLRNDRILWSVHITQSGKYSCQIGRFNPATLEFTPLHLCKHSDVAGAVAGAMLQSVGVNPMELHRELFPHKYLQVVNG